MIYMNLELYNVVYWISNVFSIFFIERFMRIFFLKRTSNNVFFYLSYILYPLITGLSYQLINIPIITLLFNLISLFIITLNYQSTILKKISTVGIVYFFMIIAEIIVVFSTQLKIFGSNDSVNISKGFDYFKISSLVIIKLLLYILALILGNFKQIRNNNIFSKFLYFIMIIIPAFSIYLIVLVIQISNLSNMVIIKGILCILTINIIVFILYDKLSEMYITELENITLKHEKNCYYNQCKTMQDTNNEIKSFKHDIKNHLIAISQLIEHDESDKLDDYISTLIEKVSNNNVYSDTQNIAIDSVINYKLRKAFDLGINVECNTIVPSDMSLPISDTVTILGNLLDNSLTACQLCNSNVDKNINLEIVYKKGILFCKVENTYNGVVKYQNGHITTIKEDTKNHGQGLKNIKTIVEKYDGTLDISHSDNTFSVEFSLYLCV